MVVFKLLSDCQKLTKIRKFSQGPCPKPPPGQLHSLDPACGGIVSFILFELLFSNCSKIVKNWQKSEYFSRGFAPDPTRACNPWTLLVGALLPSYFWIIVLKLLSDCQKLSTIGKFSRGFAPDPTRACNSWTLLVGALPPSYFLNYCVKIALRLIKKWQKSENFPASPAVENLGCTTSNSYCTTWPKTLATPLRERNSLFQIGSLIYLTPSSHFSGPLASSLNAFGAGSVWH